MPPAHLATIANLTFRPPVGAGHARPATLPLHSVQPKTVGEGFIPPAYPTPSLTQRPARRGGIHAARAPCLYHQPTPCHPVGAGHARPATYPILRLVSIAQQIPNMHLAQKFPLKICRKNQKQPLTTVIHIAIISKLSRGGGRGKPFYQQLVRFFEENFFKKLSENLLTNERI